MVFSNCESQNSIFKNVSIAQIRQHPDCVAYSPYLYQLGLCESIGHRVWDDVLVWWKSKNEGAVLLPLDQMLDWVTMLRSTVAIVYLDGFKSVHH